MIQTTVLQDVCLRTVVLVGGCDFGRCSLAARLPTALWPIGDTPCLVRLLNRLAEGGVQQATVCCAEDIAGAVRAACADSRLRITLLVEELASGTAGCLRDAVAADPGGLIMVLSGSMMVLPPVEDLIETHQGSGADLTVVFNPARTYGALRASSAEIYLCDPRILAHIPCGGYSDIKETVIPAILRAGGIIRPMILDREVGNFHDRCGYLSGLDAFFRDRAAEEFGWGSTCSREQVLLGSEAFVHPSARVCGPVAIGDGARIEQGAVVVGPATVGRRAVVGEDSTIVRSALWAGAEVGAGCEIRESILDDLVRVPDRSVAAGRVVVQGAADRRSASRKTGGSPEDESVRAGARPSRLFEWIPRPAPRVKYTICGVAVLLALLWSYWPTAVELMQVWRRSDEYSCGLLVPFLAGYVVWVRRQGVRSVPVRPAVIWGIGAFMVAQAVRGVGLVFMTQAAERFSIILTVTASALLILGWQYLRKGWPILLFLCLMLPWPGRVQSAVALPLQRWSTTSAVFCLELVGYEIVRDGNVIHIGNASVAVAEACNGLRMITAFFVISGLVVLLTKRAWWEKSVILISSLPIAFLCNTLRLAVTAVFFTILEGEVWEQRFHDWGGYAMMPLALAIVIGELALLAQLTTPPGREEPTIISRRQPQHVSNP